ncbi:MAG: disulfide bond formation protein B [Pontixanthobacter sp.]
MIENRSSKLAQHLSLAIPALLLGGAYISEYGFGLFPCEMCWWQRWPHFAAIGLALISYFAPPRSLWIALAATAIMISGLIGGFHAGVEYDWWEGITGCSTMVKPEGMSALDAVMNMPMIRCDVAQWDLFGISLAGWNFLISVGGAMLILVLLARSKAAKI